MGYSTNTVANLPIILRKPPTDKGGKKEEKKKKDKMHKGTRGFEHTTWNKEQIWGKKLRILQEQGGCSFLGEKEEPSSKQDNKTPSNGDQMCVFPLVPRAATIHVGLVGSVPSIYCLCRSAAARGKANTAEENVTSRVAELKGRRAS